MSNIILISYIFPIHLHWYFLGLERQCRGQYQEVARMPTHNILCTGPCSKCTVCPLCALCSMCTVHYMCTGQCVHRKLYVHTLDTKMCAPSGKFVLACSSLCRIFSSVVHSRNPGKLSIKSILSPRTNMFPLTALGAEENVCMGEWNLAFWFGDKYLMPHQWPLMFWFWW